MRGQLLEAGADDERWPLAADARIKTDVNALGVGPVVYKGRKKDENGAYSTSGSVKDALFLFFDDDGTATMAIVENQAEADVLLTIEDFLTNHGGAIATMKTNKPTVA
jgi:hypothetical protein